MNLLEALKNIREQYGSTCMVSYDFETETLDDWIRGYEGGDAVDLEAAESLQKEGQEEVDVFDRGDYIVIYVKAWNNVGGDENGRIIVHTPQKFTGDQFLDDMLNALLNGGSELNQEQYAGVLRFIKHYLFSRMSTDEAQARVTAFENAVDATDGGFYLV